jgi:hypothetical protein
MITATYAEIDITFARRLLADLAGRDAELWNAGGKVRWHARLGVVTIGDVREIKRLRAALLPLLPAVPEPAWGVGPTAADELALAPLEGSPDPREEDWA